MHGSQHVKYIKRGPFYSEFEPRSDQLTCNLRRAARSRVEACVMVVVGFSRGYVRWWYSGANVSRSASIQQLQPGSGTGVAEDAADDAGNGWRGSQWERGASSMAEIQA